jgi:uncharacterized protein YndB with AHSA1/START domain
MTTSEPTPSSLRMQRVIPAPPHEVYRAWLDPALLRRWLAPGEWRVTRIEVDERVGGHFRVWQGTDDGDVGGFECQILDLVPSERIVFNWGFVGPERAAGPSFDSRLTITFERAPNGHTALTLVHEQLDALGAAMPNVAENVEPGWAMVLDKMTTALAPVA